MITGIVCSTDGEHDRIGPVKTFATRKDFDIAREQIGLFDDGASHCYVDINNITRCDDPKPGDSVILINSENRHIEQSVQCFAGSFVKRLIEEDGGTCWIDDKQIDLVSEGGSFHLYRVANDI